MPLTRIRQTAIGNDSITSAKLAHDLDLDGDFVRVPHGTTAQRPSSPVNGYLRYNTSFERLEQYADGVWQSIDTPPSITGLSYPSPVTAVNPAGGETITLSGLNFQTGATVTVGGTSAPTVTFVSPTSITFVTPAKTAGDYDVKITNSNGLSATLTSGITYNGVPSFTTAANLGTLDGQVAISNLTIVAAEPDGGTVSYTISTPASPDFVSINSSTGVLSGTTPASGSGDTAYNFTVTATDDENQTNTRTYTLTVLGLFYAYSIDNSLSFDSDDTQRMVLYKAGDSDGDRRTWTLSLWVKRVSNTDGVVWSHGGNSSGEGFLRIRANGVIQILNDGHTNGVDGTIPLTDTQSWYHLVWAADSRSSANGGPATADLRTRFWINGYELTNAEQGSPSNTADGQGYIQYYSAGMNVAFGDKQRGHEQSGNTPLPFDGKITDVHFIDGQQVAATAFGETKNGVWVPKAYTGTYGTNGYHLPMKQVDNNTFYNHTTYEGNGYYYNDIGNIGFKPDLVFFKVDNQTADWEWHDSVRGWNYRLLNDSSTNGEASQTNSETVTDATDDGFIVRIGNSGQIGSNWNGNSHTAYCFNGGNNIVDSDFQSSNGTTIQSSQTVNTTYGFSVTTWTAAASDPGNTTVPTGFSGTADWIIVKCIDKGSTYWPTWHSSLAGNNYYLKLNGNDSQNTTNGWTINSTGASMNWQTQASGAYEEFNEQSRNYIMYSWKGVSGYSDFGSFEGTGSDQAVTGLGFRPAMLIIKGIDSATNWMIFDDLRDTTNPRKNRGFLEGDQAFTDAPGTANYVDFDSDGFTVYGGGGDSNATGQTYIYIAFADKRTYAFWRDASGNSNDFEPIRGLGLPSLTPDSPIGNF